MKNVFKKIILVIILSINNLLGFAQNPTTYQRPPKEIEDILLHPSTPTVQVNSKGTLMLLIEKAQMPSIAELSEPELRIAGLRINPANNGLSRQSYSNTLKLLRIKNNEEIQIKNLPNDLLISNIRWSPDESKIAFANTTENTIELWIIDIATTTATKIENLQLNSILCTPFEWLYNGKQLIVSAVLNNRGNAPKMSKIPTGPIIQENIGKKTPSRTYQDLLKNTDDEAILDYYATSQLYKISLDNSEKLPIGEAGLISFFGSSPDGSLVLTKKIHKPYSYNFPIRRFPTAVELYSTASGRLFKKITDIPLQDNTPIGADATTPHARLHDWRPDKPASLYWVEALDEGNPKKNSEFRDKLLSWEFPFDKEPTELLKCKYRFMYVGWGNENYAITMEYWNANKQYICRIVDPALTRKEEVLFELSAEDSYASPGNPEVALNKFGRYVLSISNKNEIMLFGDGASPEGNKPFVDILSLETKQKNRIWQYDGSEMYEYAVSLIDWQSMKVLTRRESTNINPNYYIRNLKNLKEKPTQITFFQHPYPQLNGIQKKILRYKRADGVELTANLYLPANYQENQGLLPAFLWAYPVEYKTKEGAGQQTRASKEFIRLSTFSPIYFVTQGYAVLDNVTFPIIGENNQEPNDTYIQQLKLNAQAIIEEAQKTGAIDTSQLCVGGHSYGAFMVANLLTHTNYFKTGIACSGAYNRTLTPFGFQNEERNYWEVPQLYNQISPFQNADKIKKPILLVHGDADNNTGTFTLQSDRYFAALKGLGANVRFVNFPYESHTYKAKETLLHLYWEMDKWLKNYLKKPEQPSLNGK